jgi:sirohydrochlorin ferrochelatase
MGGILVMAHGGSPEWNEAISTSVAPVAERIPTAVAFGMADPSTLQAAVDSLAGRGVTRIAVVRLFVSGRSFLAETNRLLGLEGDQSGDAAPASPTRTEPPDAMGHAATGVHGASGGRVDLPAGVRLATHQSGLIDGIETGEVLRDRAASASRDPGDEVVILLAHGMGSEVENDALLEAMRSAAEPLAALGFQSVQVRTLREDWPDARAAAEAEIRRTVTAHTEAGRRVLVIPVRLSGFGPYATVLDGLEYEATTGLLPHAAIARWMERTGTSILCAAEPTMPMAMC